MLVRRDINARKYQQIISDSESFSTGNQTVDVIDKGHFRQGSGRALVEEWHYSWDLKIKICNL